MERKTKMTVIILEIAMAIIFILGSRISYQNQAVRIFYEYYFADILIPFNFYFLLILIPGQQKFTKLKPWFIKAITIFSLCSLSETLQYFGIYALARVFDPVDYAMYGVGVVLAALIDRQLFKKVFSYWE